MKLSQNIKTQKVAANCKEQNRKKSWQLSGKKMSFKVNKWQKNAQKTQNLYFKNTQMCWNF